MIPYSKLESTYKRAYPKSPHRIKYPPAPKPTTGDNILAMCVVWRRFLHSQFQVADGEETQLLRPAVVRYPEVALFGVSLFWEEL